MICAGLVLCILILSFSFFDSARFFAHNVRLRVNVLIWSSSSLLLVVAAVRLAIYFCSEVS